MNSPSRRKLHLQLSSRAASRSQDKHGWACLPPRLRECACYVRYQKIFPERFEKLFRNGIFALVRCPYKVDEDSDVGMGHGAGSDCTRGKECRLPPEHEMNKENRPPPHPSNRNSGACRGPRSAVCLPDNGFGANIWRSARMAPYGLTIFSYLSCPRAYAAGLREFRPSG